MNPNFDNISWSVNALQLLEEHCKDLIPYAELNLPHNDLNFPAFEASFCDVSIAPNSTPLMSRLSSNRPQPYLYSNLHLPPVSNRHVPKFSRLTFYSVHGKSMATELFLFFMFHD